MRWASAISTAATIDDALAETASAITAQLAPARADLVLGFVTDHLAGGFGALSAGVAGRFPGATFAGCTAGGAIGGGAEVEHRPALALTAASLPGVRLAGLHLGPDPDEWPAARADRGEDEPSAVLLLPCPLSSPTEALLGWCDERWPHAVKIGGLASGGMTGRGPSGNTLFLGEALHREGAVAVTFAGDIAVDTIVAQGCRPIGQPMVVTKGLGNVVLELDGEPALAVLERLHASLSSADRALCRHSLFIGLHPGPVDGVRRRDVLIRNLMGCDRKAGAIAIGAPIGKGLVVQFHLRDADTSDQDLRELLAEPQAPAAGALLFSCVGRGQLLYGHPGHDSRAFRQAFGPVPLAGFFCNGEIGPVGGRTFMHGYTSAFALFRRRGAQA